VSEICRHYTIANNHPCLAGHFPNNPVIPGVVVLDYLRDLFEKSYADEYIKTIINVKFSHPLYPEQQFSLYLKRLGFNKVKFRCISHREMIIHGVFMIEKRV